MYGAIDASSKLLFNWHAVNMLDKLNYPCLKVALLRAGVTIHKQGIGLSHLPALLLQ